MDYMFTEIGQKAIIEYLQDKVETERNCILLHEKKIEENEDVDIHSDIIRSRERTIREYESDIRVYQKLLEYR